MASETLKSDCNFFLIPQTTCPCVPRHQRCISRRITCSLHAYKYTSSCPPHSSLCISLCVSLSSFLSSSSFPRRLTGRSHGCLEEFLILIVASEQTVGWRLWWKPHLKAPSIRFKACGPKVEERIILKVVFIIEYPVYFRFVGVFLCMYNLQPLEYLEGYISFVACMSAAHVCLYVVRCMFYVVRCMLYGVRCILYVLRCMLHVVCCTLHVVRCTLYVVRCMLYVVCCMLYVVCCTLYVVCCMLYVVCCTLYVVCCTLYVVRCTLYVVRCMLYVVCCTLYVVRCMLYVVCCTLYVVCCTLYVVRCMLCVVCCTLYVVWNNTRKMGHHHGLR